MRIAKPQSGTRVDEVEERIYRISTPVTKLPSGFSFDQYLIEGDEPLLFHTGPRKLFPVVRDASARRWRSSGSATSPSRISRRTNAARSTNPCRGGRCGAALRKDCGAKAGRRPRSNTVA